MNPFQDKNIVLGVTGSIAAYKGADLASKLAQAGAKLDVILTEAACRFIAPLSFQSVTGRRAYTDSDLWGREGHVTHIVLGHTANLFIIAPVSANTMAKLANGIADNLLSVAALAATCPLVLAPAMDAGMYAHPATRNNVAHLVERGAVLVGPASGHLASGLVGLGRFAETSEILGTARYVLARGGALAGKKVVVTAGGTQEPIDPVRIITNRSSGRQGFAIAQAAIDCGADVTLIAAPTNLTPPVGATFIPVRTAAEMQSVVLHESAHAFALDYGCCRRGFPPRANCHTKNKKINPTHPHRA